MDKPRKQVQFTRMGATMAAAFAGDLRAILEADSVKAPRFVCPHCYCRFGEKTCPHWVWTFTGPVFMAREHGNFPIKVTYGDAPSKDSNH